MTMSARVPTRRSLVLGGGGALLVGAFGIATAPTASAAYTRVLAIGMRGSDVSELQRALNESGFWCGGVDGAFGSLTQQAVWALQKSYGAARTGKVDSATWQRAMSRKRPTPRYPTLNGIEVDLTRQLLMVVRSGKVVVTLNTSTGNGETFPFNGGTATATTPKGTYRILRKSPKETSTSPWVTGELGSMYKPRYFTWSGHAIHGSTSIPPYPASHGCCRLSTAGHDLLLRSGYLGILTTYVRIY